MIIGLKQTYSHTELSEIMTSAFSCCLILSDVEKTCAMAPWQLFFLFGLFVCVFSLFVFREVLIEEGRVKVPFVFRGRRR